MTALIASILVVVILLVWALRGDKVKRATEDKQRELAEHRKRLGISDDDAIFMHNGRAFGLLIDTHLDVVTVPDQASGRFTGSLMRVENYGQLSSRITATRVLALGVFALGARKTVDNRELFVTVDGDGFQLAVKLPPTLTDEARRFAAAYNTRSGAMDKQSVPTITDGVATELERLAALRATGALSEEEFAVAKARLLGTTTAEPQPEDRRW